MSDGSIWWGGARPDPARMTATGAHVMPGLLGIEFLEVGDDWISARMPVDARTHQPWGRLHGGASVALAETVASIGAAATLDPERFVAVGMEINANHLRPAHEGWVIATGTCESRGRTSQVWTIRIKDEAGKLVCLARMTAAVIPLERK